MGLDDDVKLTTVQVMAWCHEATSHYLSQSWSSSVSPYGITNIFFCWTCDPTGYWNLLISNQTSFVQNVVHNDQSLNIWINVPRHSVHHDRSACWSGSNFLCQMSGKLPYLEDWVMKINSTIPTICKGNYENIKLCPLSTVFCFSSFCLKISKNLEVTSHWQKQYWQWLQR